MDSFFDEPTSTASHVVADPVTKRYAVIDPVLGYDPDSGCTDSVFADTIVDFIKAGGYGLNWIIETHLHAIT